MQSSDAGDGERTPVRLEEDDLGDEVIATVMSRVAGIIDVVASVPEPYRVATFTELLRAVLEQPPSARTGAGEDGERPATEVVAVPRTGGRAETSLLTLAGNLGVDPTLLSRTIQIGEGGSVQILARVPGRSVRDRQIRVAQIICYIREKVFAEFKTDVETIRTACVAQGAYDSPNFSANFRKDGTLREASVPGSKERLYMLSPTGMIQAEAAVRELLATA